MKAIDTDVAYGKQPMASVRVNLHLTLPPGFSEREVRSLLDYLNAGYKDWRRIHLRKAQMELDAQLQPSLDLEALGDEHKLDVLRDRVHRLEKRLTELEKSAKI